jgi:glycosyltransferase involved in cell wall biosynthesis
MKRIRVGFDISQLAHPGGVATYTKNLAEELIMKDDLEMAFFYSSLRAPYKGSLKGVKKFKLPPTLFEVLFNKIRNVPIEKFLGPMDIFHSSDWVQPPAKAITITTYHDVIPLKYPNWSHPKIIKVHKDRLKIVEKEIDCVIAVSEATKKDLLEVSKIPADKIVVIYEGVGKNFKILSAKEVELFRKKYNLPKEFILGIGGVGSRRNLERVKAASKGKKLIITGQDIWVENDELPLLYNAASVLLYPSLYEGFGLPILEAQACGLPVITSDRGSMKEVSGKGAILVDPEKTEDIKEVLTKILTDKNTAQELARKGLENAKQYSWQKCGEETAQLYKKLVIGKDV